MSRADEAILVVGDLRQVMLETCQCRHLAHCQCSQERPYAGIHHGQHLISTTARMITELEASSSIASDVILIAAFLLVSLLVVLLLRRFLPLRTTPTYLLVPIFLALTVPASIVLLVPVDLASSAGPRGVWLPDNALLVAWRIAYWLCFVLTW